MVRITVTKNPKGSSKICFEKCMNQYISKGMSYDVTEEQAAELKNRDYIEVHSGLIKSKIKEEPIETETKPTVTKKKTATRSRFLKSRR